LEPVDDDLVMDELIAGGNHDCLVNFNPCRLDHSIHFVGSDHIYDFIAIEPQG
jgi:hypothetical protein